MQYCSFVKRPSFPQGDGRIEQPVKQETLFCLDTVPILLDENQKELKYIYFITDHVELCTYVGRFFGNFKKNLVGPHQSFRVFCLFASIAHCLSFDSVQFS